jgi:DNA polymerase III epsilon subunit-like protein
VGKGINERSILIITARECKMNFVALDVETSNPDLASICQIGIVTFSNGVVVDKRQSLVNPEDYFNGMNVYLHGITEEKVMDAPNFQQVYSDLKKLIENRVIPEFHVKIKSPSFMSNLQRISGNFYKV